MKIFVAFMMTVILLPNSKAQFTAQAAAGRGQYTITTTQGLEFQSLIYYVPVSYTHLDVYKRQIYSYGIGLCMFYNIIQCLPENHENIFTSK